MEEDLQIKFECKGCRALCCKEFIVSLGTINPIGIESYGFQVSHKNTYIAIDKEKGEIALIIKGDCEFLIDEQCSIYNDPKRFSVCGAYELGPKCLRYFPWEKQNVDILNTYEDYENYDFNKLEFKEKK